MWVPQGHGPFLLVRCDASQPSTRSRAAIFRGLDETGGRLCNLPPRRDHVELASVPLRDVTWAEFTTEVIQGGQRMHC